MQNFVTWEIGLGDIYYQLTGEKCFQEIGIWRAASALSSPWRLFGDRYKSVLVEGEGFYYQTLIEYLHLNPARARLVNPENDQSVLDY
jgi:hypothetical protein